MSKKSEPNNTSHSKKANKNKLLLAMANSSGVVTKACELADLSRWTFYSYYNEDKEFKKEVDDIRESAIDVAETKLHEAINEGNLTAVIFYLKTKGKNRGYVERQESHVKQDRENLPEWLEDEE